MADRSLIKVALNQFVLMNYGNEVKLKRIKGKITWEGTKNLHVYTNHFEKRMLEQTRTFYSDIAITW